MSEQKEELTIEEQIMQSARLGISLTNTFSIVAIVLVIAMLVLKEYLGAISFLLLFCFCLAFKHLMKKVLENPLKYRKIFWGLKTDPSSKK